MPNTTVTPNFDSIRDSLEILGLEPGVTVEDVHAAFRSLVRTCHPDVAGRQGAARFQEITNAYSILKGLTTEMLAPKEAETPSKERERGTLFDWYQKRRREQLDEKAKQTTKRPNNTYPLGKRIDRVLDQYDGEISRRLEQIAKEATEGQINGLLLRLRSSVPEVRRLALSRLGALANNEKMKTALAGLMYLRDIDSETARLLYALPLNIDTQRNIAEEVADHAPDLLEKLTRHTSAAVRLWSRALVNAKDHSA